MLTAAMAEQVAAQAPCRCVILSVLLVLPALLLISCGSEPTPTPDAVATQVAVERSVAATLTAGAPTATHTPRATATSAPTATDTSTVTPSPTATETMVPTDTPTPSPTPLPFLDADVSLPACRLTLDDVPAGFTVAMSKTLDLQVEDLQEGDVQFVEHLAGRFLFGIITMDEIIYIRDEAEISLAMGSLQGPSQAHEAMIEGLDWWSFFGLHEPFDLTGGPLGDETVAFYHRPSAPDDTHLCRVAVRYGAGVAVLWLKSWPDLSQEECGELARRMDARIAACTTR